MAKKKTVGERIRDYREKANMTVYDLAQKSGLPERRINDIEKGLERPALGILTRLSRALDQRLGTFMDDQFKPDPIITRSKDLASDKVAKEGVNKLGYAMHSLAIGKADRHMEPFRIEFEKDGVDALQHHEGEELIICIAGEVELTYGHDDFLLEAGDTAYYNSVVPHGLRAAGGKPASIYGVVFFPFEKEDEEEPAKKPSRKVCVKKATVKKAGAKRKGR